MADDKKPEKKRNPITTAILVLAIVGLIALGVYYYTAVYIPAQEQASIIGGF